jgi:hypothetical protein
MAKKSVDEIIENIRRKYDTKAERDAFMLSRETGKPGPQRYGSYAAHYEYPQEGQRPSTRAVSLASVAWLRRPAPDASPVPRSALISPQSGATLIGSAKSRRRI